MNLGEMYGPLPLGGWIGVVGGGLGLAFLSNRAKGGTPAVAPVLPAGEIDAIDRTATIGSSLPPTTQVTLPGSNSEWATAVAVKLVAGGADPVLVQQALGKFLNGDPVTTAEADIIRKALRLSQPPQGTPPITVLGTVGSAPPPAPGNTGGGVITPPPAPIPVAQPPVHIYTEQEVRDLYARYGFTTLEMIGAAVWVPTGESGAARVARNVRELNNGRAWSNLEASIRILPHGTGTPNTATTSPPPVIPGTLPPPQPPPQPAAVTVGGVPVPNLSGQAPRPTITPGSTTAYSFPAALPPPVLPVSFYAPNLGGTHTIVPGAPGNTLGENVIAAALANPYVDQSTKAQLAGAFGGKQAV